jgi:uncharacterized protein
MKKQVWLALVVYYSVAFLVSNFFRFDVLGLKTTTSSASLWLSAFTGGNGQNTYFWFSFLLEGSGPLLGAWLGYKLAGDSVRKTITLSGKRWSYSLLFLLPVFVLWPLLGISNSLGIQPNLFGFLITVFLFTYCIGEEAGWRGFMYDALKVLPRWKMIGIMTVLWYAWHVTFLQTPFDLIREIILFGVLLVGSIGISKVVDQTKSIAVAAVFHMLINLTSGFNSFKVGSQFSLISFGVIIPVWIVLFIFQKPIEKYLAKMNWKL